MFAQQAREVQERRVEERRRGPGGGAREDVGGDSRITTGSGSAEGAGEDVEARRQRDGDNARRIPGAIDREEDSE